MAKMKAIEAAVKVLEKEGVSVTFGVPGAAINPLYAAMKEHGGIGHILAGMWKAPATWPRAIPVPWPATSASA